MAKATTEIAESCLAPSAAMDEAQQAVDLQHGAAGEIPACGLTVYFDGSCGLCRREIALARKLTDGAPVAFEDVSACADGAVADDLATRDAMARFHVRRADGSMVSGAAAFLEMWSASPRLRFVAPIARNRVIVAALDRVYNVFLKVRPPLTRAVNRYDAWRDGRQNRELS